MAYIIAEPCIGVKDASCVEVCPVDCIHATDDDTMYYIDPNECIDCGVCVPELCRYLVRRVIPLKRLSRTSGTVRLVTRGYVVV